MNKQNFYHCEVCDTIRTHNLKESVAVDRKLIREVLEFIRLVNCFGVTLERIYDESHNLKSKLNGLLK